MRKEQKRLCRIILLRIRTDIWEAQKHPFFKDNRLYNKHLFKLLETDIITKEDVAKVLEVSEDYVDWMVEKIKENKQKVKENDK